MRKRCLLGWMLMSGVAVTEFAAGGGQETDYSKVQIAATKVSGNIISVSKVAGSVRTGLKGLGFLRRDVPEPAALDYLLFF